MKDRTAAVLLLALSTLGWTGEGWAQAKIARVGILMTPAMSSSGDDATAQWDWYAPFRRALAQRGWIEGENVSFEYGSARGNPPQFGEAAAELAGRKVDVIYADNAPATRAAYAATRTIPIVGLDFTNDPVAAGYAQSYGRPGRNLTGFFLDAPGFAGKWLELLKAMLPGLSRLVVLWDPSPGAAHLQALQGAARSLNVQLQIFEVRNADEINKAFSAFRARPQALVVLPSPMTWGQSTRLAELAKVHRLPATSMAPEFAEAGGVLSYGPELAEAVERCAILVAEILAGAKPGDLPVERPTKFQLIVNLKAAKALGLAVPDSVLVRADKVIR
ncbi:MAG TPA: ABC transporter substrate-binding protein [Burkholderiales bacterium]|nr:ABC transporter substrate-binding protein [Burkholderiales bacterium]